MNNENVIRASTITHSTTPSSSTNSTTLNTEKSLPPSSNVANAAERVRGTNAPTPIIPKARVGDVAANEDEPGQMSTDNGEEQELLEMAQRELRRTNKNKLPRHRLPTSVTAVLEKVYLVNSRPSISLIKTLAERHKEEEARIRVWFNNRRGKQQREAIRQRIERSATIASSNQARVPPLPVMLSPASGPEERLPPHFPQFIPQPYQHPRPPVPHGLLPLPVHQQHAHAISPNMAASSSPQFSESFNIAELMSPKLHLKQSKVLIDLMSDARIPVTVEMVAALRERILQLQILVESLITNDSSSSHSSPDNSHPQSSNQQTFTEPPIFIPPPISRMIFREIENKCATITALGKHQIKDVFFIEDQQLFRNLHDTSKKLEQRGRIKLIPGQRNDAVVSCFMVTFDMFEAMFGQLYASAAFLCNDVVFRIERIVLSINEHDQSLGVHALLTAFEK